MRKKQVYLALFIVFTVVIGLGLILFWREANVPQYNSKQEIIEAESYVDLYPNDTEIIVVELKPFEDHMSFFLEFNTLDMFNGANLFLLDEDNYYLWSSSESFVCVSSSYSTIACGRGFGAVYEIGYYYFVFENYNPINIAISYEITITRATLIPPTITLATILTISIGVVGFTTFLVLYLKENKIKY